jgi:hypothetical protein
MANSSEIIPDIKNNSSRRRYLIASGVLLIIIASYIYLTLIWQSKPQIASETIIRQAAAKVLDKKLENLTKTDFGKIIQFYLKDDKLSDITFLKKFTNLKNLYLVGVDLGKPAPLPEWAKILERIGVYKRHENTSLDISILEKLPNLEILTLNGPVSNLESITRLKNLKELNIENMFLSDIEPVKKLKGLKKLGLNSLRTTGAREISLEPITKLTNLQELEIVYRGFHLFLEPVNKLVNLKKLTIKSKIISGPLSGILGNLKNLQELNIDVSTPGSIQGNRMRAPLDLEPIKELTNLRQFWLRGVSVIDNRYGYNNLNTGYNGFNMGNNSNFTISREQVEELQETLPELEFIYGM